MCRWVVSRQGGEGMTKNKRGGARKKGGGKGEEDETRGKLGREKERRG